MKYQQQDSRICIFYVTNKLLNILEYEDIDKKKVLKLLNEFKDEMIHNLGINALHNHYGNDNDKVWNPRVLQPIKTQAKGRNTDWEELFYLR